MDEIRKVRVNEVTGMFREYDRLLEETKGIGKYFTRKHIINYKWDELKVKIKSEGYQPKENGYIEVKETKAYDGYNYRVMDGNHRMSVMEDLYGPDKFIDVNVQRKSRCGMCDRAIELASTKSGKLEILNILGTTTIFLILFGKPTLMYMGFLLIFLIVLATNIFGVSKTSRMMKLNEYGKAGNLLLNTIINLPLIILSLVSFYYIWYIACSNIFGLVCVGVFSYIVGKLVDHYEGK